MRTPYLAFYLLSEMKHGQRRRECTTARELAVVVGKMLADENCRNVDKHTVVKAAFIKSLLPFAKRLVSGGTIANIRAQINNMLASK